MKEILTSNLGRALTVLPFIMLANNLFGAVLAELNDLVNTKADEVHTHDISDLRGFNGATWLNLDTLLRAIKE